MLSSRFENWLHERQTMLNDRRIRKLQRQSSSPNGKGWCFDSKNPSILYILGYSLELDNPWTPGYSLQFLEDQYRLLKHELAAKYRGYKTAKVLIEVEASYATDIFQDRLLLERLQPKVVQYRDLSSGRVSSHEVQHLTTTLVMDGDQVTFRITPGGYFFGYGIFVYDHPEDPLSDGRWCRPTPDMLAFVAGEYTL